LAGKFTGFTPFRVFIVSSGSMEPSLKTGSVVITMPQTEYKIADIVTFTAGPDKKATTTHRIVGIGGGVFRSAGDANNQPDQTLIDTSKIVGRVVFSLPYAGYLGGFAQTPRGFILLVIVPATIIIYEELKSLVLEIKKIKPKKNLPSPESGEGSGVRLNNTEWLKRVRPAIIIPVFCAAFILSMSFSLAYFSDTETSSSNSFTAWVPTSTPIPTSPPTPSPTPTPIPQFGHVVINEINWGGNNTNPDDEWVELRNLTSHPIDLTGWYIVGLGETTDSIYIPSEKTIPANGFFLITRLSKETSRINADPDFTSDAIRLVNTGEILTLKSNTNITIDTANRAGTWYAGTNTSPRKSMERKDPPDDGTSNGKWKDASTQVNLDIGATELATPKATNPI